MTTAKKRGLLQYYSTYISSTSPSSSRARIFKLLRSPRIDSKEPIVPACVAWDGIFKLLLSPEIDFEESIPPAYVAWRAGTRILFLLGSWPQYIVKKFQHWRGRYDNPIPTRFLAPTDCLKIPAPLSSFFTICQTGRRLILIAGQHTGECTPKGKLQLTYWKVLALCV